MNPLQGKSILLGITGGIAAYKVPWYIRKLKKAGAEVRVILTENAGRFVTEEVLSTISDGVYSDIWDEGIPHINLTEKADLFVIIPADYNIIGKASSGIADDLLSTSVAAYDKSVLFFPSMNCRMYENKILQDNIEKLQNYGHIIIEPETGPLACRKEGKGRLPDIDRILLETRKALTENLFKGANCLITGGGTIEKIDPVRCLTNLSTGKMALTLAKCVYMAGGNPHLILGPTVSEINPLLPYKVSRVQSASEMQKKILEVWDRIEYLFMSAAVSDFTTEMREKKIKRAGNFEIKLTENVDILKTLKNKKGRRKITGFALESENIVENTRKKMEEKGCDLMVGNTPESIGSQMTEGVIISKTEEEEFSCTKEELAWIIVKSITS